MGKDSLVWAIGELGYLSKKRIEKSGTLSEWLELPGSIRSQIFREDSTMHPDETCIRLSEYGYPSIQTADELLQALKLSAVRGNLDSHEYSLVSEYERENSELRAELERLQAENERLSQELRQASFNRSRQGGIARADSLTPERRREIAKKAAAARYAQKYQRTEGAA